jgi:hypothetical protein
MKLGRKQGPSVGRSTELAAPDLHVRKIINSQQHTPQLINFVLGVTGTINRGNRPTEGYARKGISPAPALLTRPLKKGRGSRVRGLHWLPARRVRPASLGTHLTPAPTRTARLARAAPVRFSSDGAPTPTGTRCRIAPSATGLAPWKTPGNSVTLTPLTNSSSVVKAAPSHS